LSRSHDKLFVEGCAVQFLHIKYY